MILAIDTATAEAGVAVMAGEAVLVEVSWTAGGNHSRHLTPVLRQALDLAGVEPAALTALAVCVGPGSFNGIRVGVSEAQGLATALAVPVFGVSSLDVLALPLCTEGRPVAAILPAGRGEVYAALYGGGWSNFHRQSEFLRLPPGDLAPRLPAGCILAGPGAAAVAEALPESSAVSVAPPLLSRRRPGYLAELGRRALLSGADGDPGALRPLYLRVSSAEEVRARRLQE